MKLKTIYETAVSKGRREDMRPRSAVEQVLKDAGKEYRKAKGIDKKTFDRERLTNPYADTRILNGTGEEDIKTVLVGIDIGVQEILLADKLREKGMKIDLVISHHPSGRALTNLYRVMDIQPGLWEKMGFSKKVAEGLMKERMEEVARGLAPGNNTRARDAARLIGMPLMCIHTAADNCVAAYLQKMFDKKKPKKVKNIISILKAIPEYRYAMAESAGPFILAGEENADAGKVFIDMTGGTSGPDRVLPRLSQSGVGTIVGMHCKESAYKIVKSEYMNYVIAGHMASDNIGLNLVFDEVEKKGKLKVIECSGFNRVRRR